MTASVVPLDEGRDGRSSRWDDHREERRRLILDAAAAVVESQPPGADIALQDVAERAGVVHTVVRRHFGGRTDLIRAVQADVLEQAFVLVSTPIDPVLSVYDAALGYMQATVAWADQHPALHALVERELGDGEPSELSKTIGAYTERLFGYVSEVAALFKIDITPEVEAEWHLMFAGIIGQVRATLSYWMAQGPRRMSAEKVCHLLAESLGQQVVTAIAEVGPTIDPRTAIIAQAAKVLLLQK